MTDFKILESMLLQSLEDFKLSSDEKFALKIKLQKEDDDEILNFVRNKSFDLVRSHLKKAPEHQFALIKWLEHVIKLVDSLRVPAHLRVKPQVCFSPGNQCVDAVTGLCERAKESIWVCVFTISDDRIADALIRAHKRGVRVKIISDNHKSTDLGSDVQHLKQQGIPLKLDKSSNHMHHKFAIFDESILVNGSFNWTRSASQYNQENIVIDSEAHLVKSFAKEFLRLWNKF